MGKEIPWSFQKVRSGEQIQLPTFTNVASGWISGGYQFTNVAPVIVTNGGIALQYGVISYRAVTNAEVKANWPGWAGANGTTNITGSATLDTRTWKAAVYTPAVAKENIEAAKPGWPYLHYSNPRTLRLRVDPQGGIFIAGWSASATSGCTNSRTSPPRLAISRISVEEMKLKRSVGVRNTVSSSANSLPCFSNRSL
jgi:hypothetical protein